MSIDTLAPVATNPFPKLAPMPPALTALTAAILALDEGVRTPCHKRPEFNSADRKVRESVKPLCGNCPVRMLCIEAGREAGVDVWGGYDWTPSPTSTHCQRGHKWTPANTGRNSKGKRQCLACKAERATRSRVCHAGHLVTPETGYSTLDGFLACAECGKARREAAKRRAKGALPARSALRVERMERVKQAILAHPDWGSRRLADVLEMGATTIRAMRAELVERGEVPDDDYRLPPRATSEGAA